MSNDQRERDRSRRGDRPTRFSDAGRDRSNDKDNKSDCRRLFVSNIPYEYRWTELKDLFKERVGDVAFVELFNDESGKFRGCGMVEFTTSDACKKALSVMHRYELNGRKLVLKEETGNERRGINQNRDRGNRGGGGGRDEKDKSFDNWGHSDNDPDRFNLYGLSLQFLESINVQPPLVKKVFVANLDYKADRPKIKEVFKLAGKVRNIDLAVDKDGNSRGFAVIEYDHPVEAVQAISMFDKHNLYDRRMTVRMDRASSEKPTEVKLPEGLKSIGFGLGPNGEPLRDVARNLPSVQQPNSSNMGMNNPSSALGSSMMNTVPTANVSLNGLGNSLAASGLNTNNALGGGLGLQALGLTGLGALQSQLLQQGLTANDLAGNIASALQAQGALNLNPNVGLGAASLGGGNMGSSLGNSGLPSNVMGGDPMGNGNMQGRQQGRGNMGGNPPQGQGFGRPGGGGAPGGRMGNPPPTGQGYGRDNAPQRTEKAVSDMVVITNLPPTVTWQLIREKFSECGDVKFAEMTGQETAIVRFHKEWDAERAVKMFDRTRIDGRTIDVRFF